MNLSSEQAMAAVNYKANANRCELCSAFERPHWSSPRRISDGKRQKQWCNTIGWPVAAQGVCIKWRSAAEFGKDRP